MKYKIISTLFLLLFIITNDRSIEQSLSGPDIIMFNNAQNDTTLLRNIVKSRSGELIAVKAQNKIGIILFYARKENKAEKEFLNVYKQFPGQTEAFTATYYLGRIAYNKDNYEKSKSYFSEYLNGNQTGTLNNFAQYYFIKAKYQNNDSDYVDFAHSFLAEQHDSIRFGNASVNYDLVVYLVNKYNYDQALIEAKSMDGKYPGYQGEISVKFQIGEIYLLMNNPQMAIEQYNAILGISNVKPEDAARAKCELGGVYEYQKDFENAKNNYLSVQLQYPQVKNWVIISEYTLAMLAYQQWISQPDSIHQIDCYQKLQNFITAHPTDHHTTQALNALADLLTSLGRYSEATEIYGRIITFDSTQIPITQRNKNKHNNLKAHKSLVTEAMMSKARILRDKLQRPEEALMVYESLLSISPKNEEGRIRKALCLIDLQRKDEAKVLLEKIIQEGGTETNHAKHILSKIQ